jgi:transketolase
MNLNKLKRTMFKLAYKNGWGHIASSLTALPIMKEIYENKSKNDIFILSKGHAGMALYSILIEQGKRPNMKYPYPVLDVKNGVYCTSGSLGHGLPFACGIAYAKKLLGQEGKIEVLMGDGECQEGTTWESIHTIKRLKLDNMVIHIDYNFYQANSGDLFLGFPVYWLDTILDKGMIKLHVSVKGRAEILKNDPLAHVHYLSKEEYNKLMMELK